MNRHTTTGHMAGSTHSRYPATSSAFSASAHPHEDWTKILDLAERRRIQNRIAQRNYRKKLKRRLEDLEAKAGTDTATSEQEPSSTQSSQRPPFKRKIAHETIPTSSSTRSPSQPAVRSKRAGQQSPLPGLMTLQSRSSFSHQYSRQLPDTPSPSGSYSVGDTSPFMFAPFTPTLQYSASSPTYDHLTYSYDHYPTPYTSGSIGSYCPKPGYYQEGVTNAFNLHYSPSRVASVDSNAYSDSTPLTPPLSDCHDAHAAKSPSDSQFVPPTPPVGFKSSPQFAIV